MLNYLNENYTQEEILGIAKHGIDLGEGFDYVTFYNQHEAEIKSRKERAIKEFYVGESFNEEMTLEEDVIFALVFLAQDITFFGAYYA